MPAHDSDNAQDTSAPAFGFDGARARRSSGWPDVRVACVWLPRLPLRVEVLRQPPWDGRPLVLGPRPGERRVVRLCSPEAEQAGIRPGLPLREVLPMCPEAIVVDPDPVRVAAVLDRVVAALERVSPAVEAAEDGEWVFLDLRGLEALYRGDLGALARAIRAAVPPLLRPRIGVSGGKFAASAAARMAPRSEARVVPQGATAEFLAPLPIGLLEMPFDSEVWHRLGLRTIGDLARLPFAAVQAEFGRAGARAWRLAHGRDDAPIVARGAVPTVRAALRFDDPLGSVDAVVVALDRLLARAFGDPELAGRSARRARLRALLADGTSWERVWTFKEALAERAAARRALKAKLELPNGLPPAPIDELSLELLGLGGEVSRQDTLFATRPEQRGRLAEAACHLGARYGRVPLYHAVEVEPWSRIPERRWALATCDA